jgi:hypothetical protein
VNTKVGRWKWLSNEGRIYNISYIISYKIQHGIKAGLGLTHRVKCWEYLWSCYNIYVQHIYFLLLPKLYKEFHKLWLIVIYT